MCKFISFSKPRWLLLLAFALIFAGKASAQTDADAIMIPKNYFCGGAMYNHSSWTKYWEGTFKRDNLNIGRLSTNMYSLMGNYGISNKLNVLLSVPYVTTHATGGTLSGMHGFQDLAGTLKWMPVEAELGKGTLSLYGIGTVSVPLSNYVSDFQPMSIGMHSTNLAARLMADYQLSNFFVTASGQYINRSNITIDRNSYYTTELIYSNKVAVPNVTVFNFRAGYRSDKIIAEAVVERSTSLSGFDIRKNDMPFPGNKMNFTSAGVNAKYSLQSGLEFTAGADYVVAGRNVGQSTTLHGGIYYLFDLSSSKKAEVHNN